MSHDELFMKAGLVLAWAAAAVFFAAGLSGRADLSLMLGAGILCLLCATIVYEAAKKRIKRLTSQIETLEGPVGPQA